MQTAEYAEYAEGVGLSRKRLLSLSLSSIGMEERGAHPGPSWEQEPYTFQELSHGLFGTVHQCS